MAPIGGARSGIVGGGSAIPDSGLFRYEFEQDVTDSWNSFDGTDNTSAGYSTDAQQGEYSKQYDGIDDWVDIPDVFGGLSAASFGGWVKETDGDSRPRLLAAENNNFWLFHNFTENNGWQFGVNGTTIGEGGVAYTVGNWDFVVVVYDKSGLGDGDTAKIYRDDATEIASGSPSTADITAGGKELGRIYGGGADYWEGLHDDLRSFDKALTATEVSNWYNTGSING